MARAGSWRGECARRFFSTASGLPSRTSSSMLCSMDKVRENRLRRVAQRRGLELSRSRRRDPAALDYGLYALIDVDTRGTVHPLLVDRFTHALTLDEVEGYLS